MSDVLIIGDGTLAEEMAALVGEAGYESAAYLYSVDEDEAISGLENYLEEFPGPYNLIIESIVGDRDEKRQALKMVGRHKRPGALILTAAHNASATEIGAWQGVGAAEIVGWAALPPIGNVVEVMAGLRTNPDSLAGARRFLEALDREPVIINDTVGGVLPRIVASLVNGAAFALMEGAATAEDIDKGMKLGTNYPYGPLEWADKIGLDQIVGILDALGKVHGSDRYRVCPLLRQLVLARHFGERTGRGFYTYGRAGS
ncbi:MAG: hypothetical protein GYB64_17160 [Chloroflexi bacterium]|nr:hypothetical protein [Chloroflexota bacterium]